MCISRTFASQLPRTWVNCIDTRRFHPYLRMRIQDALTEVWNFDTSLRGRTPARIAASVLIHDLGDALPDYTFIDFCAGGGGPTPSIANAVNADLRQRDLPPVDFILTDLHPNVDAWERVAEKNPYVKYDGRSVDASRAPDKLVKRADGRKVFRLFNLAFHHFDDPLARDILRDTVDTSHGFAIIELQDRSLASAFATLLLGIGTFLTAPYFGWKWRSPLSLFFTYVIPIIPFVLVFDGYVSSIRTRTPDEVEALLRSCGADAGDWEVRSGSERHLWPCAYLNWIICRPVERPNPQT